MPAPSSTPIHGGCRPGAGRKAAYGEPTTTVRVPRSQVFAIAEFLDRFKRGAASPKNLGTRSVGVIRDDVFVSRMIRPVRAGVPSAGDDSLEDVVDLGAHLVREAQSTFLMKVDGWSMRDAGICDEDELVVDRSIAVEAGRVVIAEVNGELTVKRLKRSGSGWILQAANPDFPDIVINDRDELRIWGVVTRLIRKL